MAEQALCSIPGCGKRAKALELCMAHYMRVRKYGSTRADVPIRGRGNPKRLRTAQEEIEHAIQFANPKVCWTWVFQRDSRYGYGFISVSGKKKLAHRVVCEAVHGAPPTAKHEAAHSCGKGHEGCINPHHLSWKTRRENEADKINHGTDRNGNARLFEADAMEMRALFATGKWSRQDLAKRFGIHYSSTCRVLNGQSWSGAGAPD